MSTKKNILFWFLAFLIMVAAAIYQRVTGPTHPLRGSVQIETQDTQEKIRYRFLRSHETTGEAPVAIYVPNQDIVGRMVYKRYKSHDDWSFVDLQRTGDTLKAFLPILPSAGKYMYYIKLGTDYENLTKAPKEPVILRFKDHVPDWILIPHILFMFIAMVTSMRTGLEVLANGDNVWKLTLWTTILFLIGGFVLGPLVQKYAFGAYWTGFPFGTDLTDNKVLFSIIFWFIALWRVRKGPNGKWWALVASLSLLIIYLIPHSMLGSELDFRELEGIPD